MRTRTPDRIKSAAAQEEGRRLRGMQDKEIFINPRLSNAQFFWKVPLVNDQESQIVYIRSSHAWLE